MATHSSVLAEHEHESDMTEVTQQQQQQSKKESGIEEEKRKMVALCISFCFVLMNTLATDEANKHTSLFV